VLPRLLRLGAANARFVERAEGVQPVMKRSCQEATFDIADFALFPS
jgi:hypothetical protein